MRVPLLLTLTGVIAAAAPATAPINDHNATIRVGGAVMLGTTGAEPGGVLEVQFDAGTQRLCVRPELFVNSDGKLGIAAAVLWRLPAVLPHEQTMWLGPRLVAHHQDDYAGEADALFLWNFPVPEHTQHNIEALGALGFVRDRKHDDVDLGVSLGAAYLFRF